MAYHHHHHHDRYFHRLWDYIAIRPDNVKPPLSQAFVIDVVGRNTKISSTLCFNTFVILVFHLHYFRTYYKIAAFFVYILVLQITFLVDALVSNSFGRAIVNLRKLGYNNDFAILAIMEFNLVSSQLLGYVIVNYIVTDDNNYSLKYLIEQFNVFLVAQVSINLLLTELLFYLGHSLLHTVPCLLDLHAFHHCSVRSTWNTNLLFHPIDLAIEFGLPVLSVLVMHYYVWNDQLVLLLTYLIIQLWYAYDHDENLQLYHVKHHFDCDSLYAIYSKFRFGLGQQPPKTNLLFSHMQKLNLPYPPRKKENKL